MMRMCSRCKKRPAVVYVSDGTEGNMVGLCMACAKEAGVKPINSLLENMNITDEDSYWGDIKVEFTAMPEHGRVTVAGSNKMLVFRADEGYVGNDSFTLYVTDGFNKSEEITVNVTVHEKENIPQNESLSEESSSAPTGEKENTPPLWLIILLSLLGLAIVAVAVAAIVKRK